MFVLMKKTMKQNSYFHSLFNVGVNSWKNECWSVELLSSHSMIKKMNVLRQNKRLQITNRISSFIYHRFQYAYEVNFIKDEIPVSFFYYMVASYLHNEDLYTDVSPLKAEELILQMSLCLRKFFYVLELLWQKEKMKKQTWTQDANDIYRPTNHVR